MQAVTIGTNEDSRHLERLHDVECLLMDAIAAARESIFHCEQALHELSEARSQVILTLEPPGGAAPYDAEPNYARIRSSYSAGQLSCRPAKDLTSREVEVLRLIAAGHSNRQIADALYISPRTIERHIANIYLKIDAHSKAEATLYARRHHLA